MRPWKRVTAVFDRILNVFAILAGVLIIFMMLSVAAEVVMRYFFNRPIIWMLEINEYGLLWATFLSAAWVLKNDQHIKVDVVIERLSPRPHAMLGAINSILGAIACGALVWFSTQSSWDHYIRGAYNPGSILETPTAYVLAIIPLAGLLLSIQFLRRTCSYLDKWRVSSNQQ